MSNKISVSVITPVYNGAAYIERCLESITDQTIPLGKLEHIVVDDGSTDDTCSIVNSYSETHGHVELFETTHSGPTTSSNYGIERAKGDYIVVLDSDDEFHPMLIKEMLGVLESNSDVDYVYSDYLENPVDGELFRVRTGENKFNLITIGIMHRKSTLEDLGLFDPDLYFSEYDILLRYDKTGCTGHHIDKVLFTYHRREDSQTGQADWIEEGKRELKEKYDRDINIRDY